MADPATIHRNPVQSGAFRSVGYDPETQTCVVEFQNGGVYHASVPLDAAQKFLAADSMGRHFQAQMREQFNFTRVEPAT